MVHIEKTIYGYEVNHNGKRGLFSSLIEAIRHCKSIDFKEV